MQVLGDIQVLQDTLEKVKKMSVFLPFLAFETQTLMLLKVKSNI